jgi:hypothetical protein
MSRLERFVSALKALVRLLKTMQMYALELVLAAIFFVGLYKFAVSILK